MPVVELSGIPTRYEAIGDGPPLLMFSPGGFDSTLENWTTFGRYRDLGFIEAFRDSYTCIVFDRCESGLSGGRVERVTRERYVEQAIGLIVMGSVRGLFDRDTVPGVEAEDLMTLQVPALVVPGQDSSHVPSSARCLEEYLPVHEYWDVRVAQQTPVTAPARIREFLEGY